MRFADLVELGDAIVAAGYPRTAIIDVADFFALMPRVAARSEDSEGMYFVHQATIVRPKVPPRRPDHVDFTVLP